MQCKTCGYSLWNLRSRTCPECGNAFAPSTYVYRPGAVRFCCPHCAQEYYGTDQAGLLEPRAFTCVGCNQGITLDEMVLLPVEGLSEAQTRGDTMPWLERSRQGFWRAWWGTTKRAMLSPGRLLELVPLKSSTSSAAGYACISQGIFGLTGFLGIGCGAVAVGALFGGIGGKGVISAGLAIVAGIFVGFLLMMLITLIIIWLWALAAHGILRLTGPTQAGIDRTFQALAYSSGANALTGIPCIGAYLSYFLSIWWLVSATIALKAAQKVSGGRASLAALTPPLVVTGVLIGSYVVLAYYAIQGAQASVAAARGGPAWTQNAAFPHQTRKYRAAQLRSALDHYATTNGSWPATGLHLLAENSLDPDVFVDAGAGERDASSVRYEGITLLNFQIMSLDAQKQVLDAAAAGVPEGVIASRTGDVVFTYHGAMIAPIDERLWLFVVCPLGDPATQSMIILQGNAPLILTGEERLRALAEQNLVRLELGLEPLPDPVTIDRYHVKP